MIRNLDPEGNEYITVVEFRKIMRCKNDVPEEDVEEMIEEYKSLNTQSEDTGSVIFYKGLATLH
jgi:Ca2+-binding EF-hand superfamily protein